MKDEDLRRYQRHIILDGIGVEAQEKISQGKVLVIGAGGLGSTVLPLLVGAGVKSVTFADDDKVDLSNLPRQILYTEGDIGEYKVLVAADRLSRMNSNVELNPLIKRMSKEELKVLIPYNDVVIDCTDNLQTRMAINEAACHCKVPLVFGAVSYFTGQMMFFDFRKDDCPCYSCLFPSIEDIEEDTGKDLPLGVWSPVVALIGAIQANEALKVLMGRPSDLEGKLRIFDIYNNHLQEFEIRKDPTCPVCSHRH